MELKRREGKEVLKRRQKKFVDAAIDKKGRFKPDHNYIDKAIKDFLKRGGKIRKLIIDDNTPCSAVGCLTINTKQFVTTRDFVPEIYAAAYQYRG